MPSSFSIGGELMKKLFKIEPVQNEKRKKKYPYKIKFSGGKVVPLPSQYDFNDRYIQSKGCIIAAFYMALRFVSIKKSMVQCLKYLQDNYSKGNHKNYNLEIVCRAINRLASGSPAEFYRKITKEKMKKALKAGHMILYTEKEPIHTAVLMWNGKKVIRFSNGKYKAVTVAQEIRKRCGNPWYGGCVIVKNSRQ